MSIASLPAHHLNKRNLLINKNCQVRSTAKRTRGTVVPLSPVCILFGGFEWIKTRHVRSIPPGSCAEGF
jgi:hypothetical protein